MGCFGASEPAVCTGKVLEITEDDFGCTKSLTAHCYESYDDNKGLQEKQGQFYQAGIMLRAGTSVKRELSADSVIFPFHF